jgi:hypothetical protein
MEPRNRFLCISSARICSPAGRYDNPFPTRFLTPIDCLKIPAQFSYIFPLLFFLLYPFMPFHSTCLLLCSLRVRNYFLLCSTLFSLLSVNFSPVFPLIPSRPLVAHSSALFPLSSLIPFFQPFISLLVHVTNLSSHDPSTLLLPTPFLPPSSVFTFPLSFPPLPLFISLSPLSISPPSPPPQPPPPRLRVFMYVGN